MRAEQVYGGIETMDELAKRHRTGEISWRFVAFGAAPELGELSKIERGLLERYRWGRKTLELIPHILQYLRQHRLTQFEQVSHHDGATLDIQGVHVAMGLPYPAYGRLDSLNCSRVLAIPHTSARGPNGILELCRGPNHPLERTFAGVAAHVHQYPDGKLAVIELCGQYWNDRAYTLQLFTTKHGAHADLEEWADCGEGNASSEDVAPHVARLTESALLDAIAHADILEIVDGAEECIARHHLTHTGARIDGVDYAFPFKGPDAGHRCRGSQQVTMRDSRCEDPLRRSGLSPCSKLLREDLQPHASFRKFARNRACDHNRTFDVDLKTGSNEVTPFLTP